MGLKKLVAAACAALALFALPGVCSAEIVITIPDHPKTASDFLSRVLNDPVHVKPEQSNDGGGSVFVQSIPAGDNPLSHLSRGPSDAAMWNLFALVNSQQRERHFDVMPTGLTSFQTFTPLQVSSVPLSGATWLFLLVLLGMAGTRLTRSRDGSSEVSQGKRESGSAMFPQGLAA
jgi:hypothetical protein